MARKIIPYNPILKALARKLRKTMTEGELLLWDELKNDKLLGFDFDRQRFIDNYIVDFYCRDLMLAIEIDGMSHNYEDAFKKDELRQQKLEAFGITFLRFAEAEVKHDILNVIRTVENTVISLVKNDPTVKLPKDFDRSLLE
ncbi:endonuclease domain-containing protein [Mucilaginibacter sp. RCC_168]|uniref:endonuclease domain-containing protein n=1 Tax=Mucilaginibacter sp. RCC_168 TaxID=3239221 RepID=UPI003523DFED